MSSVIRLRRGTSSQWAASTIVMAVAELGLDTTLNKLKAGNGVHTWNNLPYINVLPSELAELSQDALNSAIVAGLHISKTYDDDLNTITISSTLTNVDNTSDANKPISTATQTELNLKSPLESPAFTGVPTAPTADPTVNTTQIATTQFVQSAVSDLATEAYADQAAASAVSSIVDGAPALLNTLNELAAAIADDESYASTITDALALKAPIESPSFTGNVSGITKTMVGLSQVDNTSDIDKPISTATQSAINALNSSVTSSLEDKASKLTFSVLRSEETYTISKITDAYSRLEFTSNNPISITIPADGTDNWQIGSYVEIMQTGQGQITIGSELDVTINAPDNQFKSRVQWSSLFLEKRGNNSWLVTGDSTA